MTIDEKIEHQHISSCSQLEYAIEVVKVEYLCNAGTIIKSVSDLQGICLHIRQHPHLTVAGASPKKLKVADVFKFMPRH